MPILSVFEVGKAAAAVGDEKEEPPKEKRCYFGLFSFSLRSGIITSSVMSIVLSGASTIFLTTTRQKRSHLTALMKFVDLYIPLPYTNGRGTSFLSIFYLLNPFLSLYGAYHKSYDVMKLYNRISYIDFAWELYSGIFTIVVCPSVVVKSLEEAGVLTGGSISSDYLRMLRFFYTVTSVGTSLYNAYILYVTVQYERSLKKIQKRK